MHVAMLGDGTLNNRACCQQGLSLAEALEARLGGRGRVTVLASRGMPLEGISFQIALIPEDATHTVVAVGLEQLGFGEVPGAQSVRGSATSMDLLVAECGAHYRRVVADLQGRGLEVMVLSVPDSAVLDPGGVIPGVGDWLDELSREVTAVAAEAGATLLDVRRVLTTAGDFHGTEGPSGSGGRKLAEAIFRALNPADESSAEPKSGRWATGQPRVPVGRVA